MSLHGVAADFMCQINANHISQPGFLESLGYSHVGAV